MDPLDERRLFEALALAESAIGLSDPNPRVGCIIGTTDGSVIGQGFTQAAGQAHAEVMALRDAASRGLSTQGATAWVTLEPCSHHGRTPPCCDALIAAGLGRVVIAVLDPAPVVNGQGVARLRAAGIQVDFASGPVVAAAQSINAGFFKRMQSGRPWVRVKLAMSLDGRSALSNGQSQWITSPEARADGHRLRKRAGIVLTGIGTVLADDPRLDVREVPTTLQPGRAVLDSRGRLPHGARVLQPPGRCLVFCASEDSARRLEGSGAEVQVVASDAQGLSLPAVLDQLGARFINEVHVEAGPALCGAFLRDGWADEVVAYVAPCLLGVGRPAAALPELARLSDRLAFDLLETGMVGPDLRLRMRPASRQAPAS